MADETDVADEISQLFLDRAIAAASKPTPKDVNFCDCDEWTNSCTLCGDRMCQTAYESRQRVMQIQGKLTSAG